MAEGGPVLPGDVRAGLLRRVGQDFRSGRNIELYLTVALSLIIAILSAFAVVNVRVVGAVTLAVLALLAASGLATRRRSEETKARLDQLADSLSGEVAAARFLRRRMLPLDQDISTAADVRLVGVTLTRTVRDLLPVLDRRLRLSASLRVLVIDVDSPAHAEAAARSLVAESPDFYRHRLASTIDLLRVLAAAAPQEAALQLRVLPYVPTFGMCLIDPDQAHGRIHVEIYQHRTIAPEPVFSLHADRDNPWYQLFLQQFEILWESGRLVQLIPPA